MIEAISGARGNGTFPGSHNSTQILTNPNQHANCRQIGGIEATLLSAKRSAKGKRRRRHAEAKAAGKHSRHIAEGEHRRRAQPAE
jgi:hypothetical protein